MSRWGRFQDADESAHYEYSCKQAGIQVIYCAEQFENDGSPVSTIVKGVKRAMAGEYSRELSAKVFAGQCRLIELGFRQGGMAGFGLRRVLLDQSGETKAELKRGEHKSLQTDRVVLRPGPEEEVAAVRKMYGWFIDDGLSETDIAARLNGMGIPTDLGRPWTRGTVHEVLTNEKYIGSNVYNRVSFKLKRRRVVNPPDLWVRKDEAFEAIVSPVQFYTAQGIVRARSRRYSDEELLTRLKSLYDGRGYLSGILIDETEGMASSSVYSHRFGSLVRAYTLVGFTPDRDYGYLEINRLLRRLHPEIVQRTEAEIVSLGGHVERDPGNDLLRINDEWTVSIVLARCRETAAGGGNWKLRLCPWGHRCRGYRGRCPSPSRRLSQSCPPGSTTRRYPPSFPSPPASRPRTPKAEASRRGRNLRCRSTGSPSVWRLRQSGTSASEVTAPHPPLMN